jgi:copper(I)-binding protein
LKPIFRGEKVMKWYRSAILFLVLVGLLAGCGGSSDEGLAVESVWMRNSPMMNNAGAAYMVIHNEGASEDRLISASSDAAATIELHETKEVDGMMQMAPVEGGILVPADGMVELKPGGLHVMFIGLTRELNVGDEVEITLTFEKAGTMNVTAEVREE